jgi:hypothetical protein
MTFAAGSKLRAAELNDVSPLLGILASSASVTSSTTLVQSALAVTIEASSEYALDGYIAYDAGATGDFKMALTVPTGATGHWGLHAVATGSSANGGTDGDMTALRLDAFGTSNVLTAAGSTSFSGRMVALIRGYISTSTSVGAVTVHFAQNTSNATATTLASGSWLRLWKIT